MTTKRNDNAADNRPSHTVYHVVDQGKDKKFWNAVGSAWPHKDGKGFSIRLDSLPVAFDGNLTIRERNKEEGQ